METIEGLISGARENASSRVNPSNGLCEPVQVSLYYNNLVIQVCIMLGMFIFSMRELKLVIYSSHGTNPARFP